MKNKTIKDSILKLIALKTNVKELIDTIYHESEDVCLKIYTEDPISIFIENPRGLELVSNIFKKRILTDEKQIEGDYPIKKYFFYKEVEFFCLYKEEIKDKKSKLSDAKIAKVGRIVTLFGNIASVIKTIGSVILSILKFVVK
jgi:hypothetical protein